MSRRIEIELTSRTGDGAYTWRAAGAKQPKGMLTAELVPDGTSVGDIVRAEVESGLEGLEVVAVLARQEKDGASPESRIEVIGTPRRDPDVVVSYAGGARRRREPEGPERVRAREQHRSGAGREPVDARRPAARRRPDGERSSRAERTGPRMGEREPRDQAPRRTERGRDQRQTERSPRPERAAAAPPVRRDRRPSVVTTHRNAMLAILGPHELPVAEQLLRGGIPAVRQALAETGAEAGSGPAPSNSETVLSIAEQLLPRVNLATWKDRATSAQAAGKELRLRELRAVVTASRTVTLDDEARAMSRALRELLDQRVTALREEWVARMVSALDDGRVVAALSTSERPPEPATRVPAELAVRLADAAGSAMTADSGASEWIELLGAVLSSPVRRNVKPRGIPTDASARNAALRAAGSVPELSKLLGLRIPPPPPPRRPAPGGARVMAGGGAARAGGR